MVKSEWLADDSQLSFSLYIYIYIYIEREREREREMEGFYENLASYVYAFSILLSYV